MTRSKKAASLIVSTALALGLVPSAAMAEPTTSDSLAAAQARMNELGSQLVALDKELEEASTELERTDNLIERIERQQGETEDKLADAKEVLSMRLRSNYKTGDFDFLEFLFGSSSLDDLLSRFYYMEKVAQGDAAAIAAVNELADELSAQKQELEQNRSDQLERVSAIEAQVSEHTALVSEARSYYNQLDASIREEIARQAAAAQPAADPTPAASDEPAGESTESAPVQQAVQTEEHDDAAAATAAIIEAINEPEQPVVTEAPAPEPEPEEEAPAETVEESYDDEEETATAVVATPSSEPFPGGGVASAYSALGWPYVWGGYLPSQGGFDCSGLVSFCYGDGSWRRGCESLAAAIIDAGLWKSSVDELSVGDLIFTDSEFNHVQIYIGGGQVIHAPFPGEVVKIQDIYAFYGGGPFVMP